MTEHNKVEDVTSSRGAQWAGAGSLIAIAASALTGGNNGGLLGGLFGGGCGQQNAQISALMAENAQLKADQRTDAKVYDLATLVYGKDKAQDAALYAIDKRLSAVETAAPLREEILKGKIGEVAALCNNGITALQGQVNCLANTVSGITKTVVPITAVCPQPMAQYNSWTAPTTGASAA